QPDLYYLEPARRVLRLYASLSAAQRQMAWQGGTLPGTALTESQRHLLLAAVQERNRSNPNPAAPPDLLRAGFAVTSKPFVRVKEQRGDSFSYRDEVGSAPASALARGGQLRYPVSRVSFQLRAGAEPPTSVDLIVSMPESPRGGMPR